MLLIYAYVASLSPWRQSILRQEIGWFDRESNNSGALASLLSTEATYVKGAVADVIGLLIQNLTTLTIGYFIALFFDWRMALVVTGILPLLVIAQVGRGGRRKGGSLFQYASLCERPSLGCCIGRHATRDEMSPD